MKIITITKKSGLSMDVKVDDEDFEYINKFKWVLNNRNKNYYAVRNTSRLLGKQKQIKMHREILKMLDNPNVFLDHIDGNGLNNQKSNLRIATNSQNGVNRIGKKGAKSVCKYRGVCLAPYLNRSKPFVVRIKHNGKKVHLGYYETELAGALAYDEAAKKYHGEFAILNFK